MHRATHATASASRRAARSENEAVLVLGTGNPFTRFLLQCHVEHIEQLVRVLSRPKPIRKAAEVPLINVVEDGHRSLRNDLSSSSAMPNGRCLPAGFRNLNSTLVLCPGACDRECGCADRPSDLPTPSRINELFSRKSKQTRRDGMLQSGMDSAEAPVGK